MKAIASNIKSKKIHVQTTNAKITDDCLSTWLALMSLCDAGLAAGAAAGYDDYELLIAYFACVDGAAVFMYACSN
jgi:hypothetical protein